jgi:2-C-methyl-D-erythritol 4-phosphate cytidylyltransferase / 2-C-methyl-D-erythritol 2,4-cyclodiphosphate synthase
VSIPAAPAAESRDSPASVRYWVVVPAAGAGRRFGGGQPKQYARVAGRTLLEWSLQPFIEDVRCRGIVVAIAADDHEWPSLALPRDKIEAAAGGAERSDSVRSALATLAPRAQPDEWVLVHDAVRPCLTREDLDRLLSQLAAHPVGGLLAVPVADTLKKSTAPGAGATTVDRAGLWRALTPQMFRYGALRSALDGAAALGRVPTDEAQAIEWAGGVPALVAGSATNVKVTTPDDLAVVRGWLAGGEESAAMRIGSGFDVHAFGAGDSVMLGGVRIPHTQGVVAHSDGDVVLHALCDALLGAAGLGDIGEHFRDDDPRWKGADSGGFVRNVLGMLRARSLAVVNADVTVIAQAPRLGAHRAPMRERIAALLEVPPDAVNVKATTTERLGFVGRGEGIAAQAVVMLRHA